jgi:HD-GYP domain-containing protein (c-di-GMP phosphodiesterase class II)
MYSSLLRSWSIKAVNPDLIGKRLAKPVIINNIVLLDEGIIIQNKHIALLRKWNIRSVIISEKVWTRPQKKPPKPSFVKKELTAEEEKIIFSYQESMSVIKHVQKLIMTGEDIDLSECERVITAFEKSLEWSKTLCKQIINTDTPDNYLLAHSINVSILSMLIAKRLNYSKEEIITLGIAGLLHDIGMIKVKDKLWDSNKKISENDFFEIMKHPIFGSNMISHMSGFSGPISKIIYQHHERLDGSGYPKGTSGESIGKLSRVIMVADVYEAATSKRKYKIPKLYHYAIKELINLSGVKFDRSVVKALVMELSLYPIGSFVRLSNGKIAKVVNTVPEFPDCPLVQILSDSNQKGDYIINIQKNVGPKITEVLEYNQ